MVKYANPFSTTIINKLKESKEIWVAVALINYKGLKIIQENIPHNCKQNYLVGVDLPSDPKALEILHHQQFKKNVSIKIFSSAFFHPKVYLIQTSNSYNSFIGSSNLTEGGFEKNLEFNIEIADRRLFNETLKWYNELFANADPVTISFLKEYKKIYKDRLARKRADKSEVNSFKKKKQKELNVILRNKNQLISTIKKFKKSNEFEKVKYERNLSLKELHKSLDYPNFQNFDIEEFFSIYSLGHIIAIPKNTILSNKQKFRKLLKYICDDNIELAVRYDNALNGRYSLRGVKEAFISKVLIIHNHKKYFVKNDKSLKGLKKYGLELPKGLSAGEKYSITNNFLLQICKQTGLQNLAVLDHLLYTKGNE
jgi:HKD family nuclease